MFSRYSLFPSLWDQGLISTPVQTGNVWAWNSLFLGWKVRGFVPGRCMNILFSKSPDRVLTAFSILLNENWRNIYRGLELNTHLYLLQRWRMNGAYLRFFKALSWNWEKQLRSIVMSVCPFVRMEELGYHWMDFHEIWYLNIFWKSAEKV
jgi:hypothetical protein